MIRIKKYLPLLFFIILLAFQSCKKEELDIKAVLTDGTGTWDVEWVKTFRETYQNEFEATSNYTNPGKFKFNSDGTGTYIFVDTIDFDWNFNDKTMSLNFKKEQIKDQTSPIIFYYLNTMYISTYRVFCTNAKTCKFTFLRSGYSSTDVFKKMEFVVTKP